MINNKIYHSIYVLAEKLLEADSANDKETFDTLYVQLKDLCIENEKGNRIIQSSGRHWQILRKIWMKR